MHFKNKNTAFTVMELLVVITIIITIVIWASNINFNSSTNKQKLEIFTNKIISKIETIRTNDLVWKAEINWTELKVPERWILEVSNQNYWKLVTKTEKNWIIKIVDELEIEEWYSIKEVSCSTNDWTFNTTDKWIIIFEKWQYKLDWVNCNSGENKIKIKTKFLANESNIYFDIVNWLITKD